MAQGIIVGIRWASFFVFLTLLLSWEVYSEFPKKKKNKTSSELQFCGWKHLVDERGQRRMTRLVGADRGYGNSDNHSL